MIFLFPGRHGTAITLVTQFDVRLVHAIEEFVSKSCLLVLVSSKIANFLNTTFTQLWPFWDDICTCTIKQHIHFCHYRFQDGWIWHKGKRCDENTGGSGHSKKRGRDSKCQSKKRGRDSKCQSKREAEIIHVNEKGVDCKCHSKREMEIASVSAFIELHVEIVIIYMSVFMYCF